MENLKNLTIMAENVVHDLIFGIDVDRDDNINFDIKSENYGRGTYENYDFSVVRDEKNYRVGFKEPGTKEALKFYVVVNWHEILFDATPINNYKEVI